MKKLLALAAVVAALFLAGCGGGSGSDSTSSAASDDVNLKISEIQQPASDANAGHGIDLQYVLDSDADVSNAVVNFYIMNSDQFGAQEDDETTPQSEQYYIGSDVLEAVVEGENNRTVHFLIPEGVETGGEYFVIAQVDPDNLISETNEEDNIFSTSEDGEARAASFQMNVSTAYKDVANFIVKELVLEETSVIIDDEDIAAVDPSQIDLSAEYPVHPKGHVKGYATVLIEGKIPTAEELQAVKVKAQVNVGGAWTDLYSWNYDDSRYAEYATLQVDTSEDDVTLEEGETLHKGPTEITVNFDVNIPASAAVAMLNEIVANVNLPALSNYNKFDVRFVIDPDNVIAELNEEDNSFTIPISVYSFPNQARSKSKYLMEKSYYNYIGNKKKASVKIRAYSKNGIETETKKGAVLDNEISLQGYAFSKTKMLYAIKAYYGAYLNSPGDTGYSEEIELFENTIYSEEQWADQLTVGYERSWNKEKSLVTANFTVGPVPMTVEVGVDGSFDINFEAVLSARDNTDLISSENHLPDMEYDLYAISGVGNSFFSAGPIVDLLLMRDLLTVSATANVDYSEELDKLLTGTATLDIKNKMKAIQGKFGVYVKYSTTKWCKKWIFPYPCGTEKKRTNYYIYKTKAKYNKNITLYNETKDYIFNEVDTPEVPVDVPEVPEVPEVPAAIPSF